MFLRRLDQVNRLTGNHQPFVASKEHQTDWGVMAAGWLVVSEHLVARVCDDVLAIVDKGHGANEAASARLRLLRAAWSCLDRSLDRDDIAAMTALLVAPPFLVLDLDGMTPQAAFSPPMARIILNLVLLGVEAVGGPGRVILTANTPDEAMLRIDGPVAAWPTGLVSILYDADAAEAALDRRETAQAAITALLTREAGARLSLLLPAGRPVAGEVPPLLLQSGAR